MEAYIFGFITILLLVAFPFVPQLLRIRIKILSVIRLNWLAKFHERHFDGLVIFIRIMIVVGIIVSGYLATTGSVVN